MNQILNFLGIALGIVVALTGAIVGMRGLTASGHSGSGCYTFIGIVILVAGIALIIWTNA
jgi:hypothetical protein